MPVPAPIIQMNKVCFAYRQREVLHNINFSLKPTDMMAIVGPNGGGKTTLLQLILGLLSPLHGAVELLGDIPQNTRNRVGYVPQKIDYDPLFPISVSEIVRLGMLKLKKSKKEKRALLEKNLELTGSGHLFKRTFASLSGGERQRVMIAHALACEPKILIMDEPTANVDPESEHDLYELFKRLNSSTPILFVSHNLNVVSRYVSHVLCVNKTACAHPIHEVIDTTFTELFGGELAIINHGRDCHISDPSSLLSKPEKLDGHSI